MGVVSLCGDDSGTVVVAPLQSHRQPRQLVAVDKVLSVEACSREFPPFFGSDRKSFELTYAMLWCLKKGSNGPLRKHKPQYLVITKNINSHYPLSPTLIYKIKCFQHSRTASFVIKKKDSRQSNRKVKGRKSGASSTCIQGWNSILSFSKYFSWFSYCLLEKDCSPHLFRCEWRYNRPLINASNLVEQPGFFERRTFDKLLEREGNLYYHQLLLTRSSRNAFFQVTIENFKLIFWEGGETYFPLWMGYFNSILHKFCFYRFFGTYFRAQIISYLW